MSSYVLDASAILALLNKEVGYTHVESILSDSIISSVNYSEVLSVLINHGITPQEAKLMLNDVVSPPIAFEMSQAIRAAELRDITKVYGLSFGDRACLALGLEKRLPVLTADKVWARIDLLGVKIELIR